jgi:hypothetical protein
MLKPAMASWAPAVASQASLSLAPQRSQPLAMAAMDLPWVICSPALSMRSTSVKLPAERLAVRASRQVADSGVLVYNANPLRETCIATTTASILPGRKRSNVAQTKKLLVNFDRKNPKRSSSDFLIPFPQESRVFFRGLRSGRERAEGLLAYIGESITEEELVSRLAESGKVEFDHARLLEMCRQYVANLQELRIGNIVRLIDAGDCQFELERIANTPSGLARDRV